MKIISLYIENLKRLGIVEIIPSGPLVQITGANGSGKSSVLDSIYFAIAGKKAIDAVPVRQGEETATVKLDLGELIVTRKFSADGTTSVSVESAAGARYPSPQAILDRLFGSLTFDPLEFSRMDAKARTDTLRRMVKLDVDVDQLDRDNLTDYNRRRDVNRDIAQLEPRAKALKPVATGPLPERVDAAQLVEDLRKATNENTDIERRRLAYAEQDKEIARVEDSYVGVLERLAELEREKARLETIVNAQHEARKSRPPLPVLIDTTAIAAKIEEAHHANRKADEVSRAVDEYSKLEEQLATFLAETQALTLRMDERSEQKRAAVAGAAMPVPGLSFGDEFEVLFQGLPFEQASSAEQLRTSVAIAMATNPRLRVLRIKDGSLLDETSLALVAGMAEAGDYQIWVERVDTSGRVGVVMENGAVKAQPTE